VPESGCAFGFGTGKNYGETGRPANPQPCVRKTGSGLAQTVPGKVIVRTLPFFTLFYRCAAHLHINSFLLSAY